jgi:hypothetical protein
VKEYRQINVISRDNCLFGIVSTILYGKNTGSFDRIKDKCAAFMRNNHEYYSEIITMDEQPHEVLMALAKTNYTPFLNYWNRKGSD